MEKGWKGKKNKRKTMERKKGWKEKRMKKVKIKFMERIKR